MIGYQPRVVMVHATNSDNREHHTRKASRRLALRESRGREPEAARAPDDSREPYRDATPSTQRRENTLGPPDKIKTRAASPPLNQSLCYDRQSREGGWLYDIGLWAQRVNSKKKKSQLFAVPVGRGRRHTACARPNPLPHGLVGEGGTRAEGTCARS
jgi:hypothetical protein